MASASPLLYSLLESTMKEVMATLFKLEMSSAEDLHLLTLCSVYRYRVLLGLEPYTM